jgi:hypothetical protein
MQFVLTNGISFDAVQLLAQISKKVSHGWFKMQKQGFSYSRLSILRSIAFFSLTSDKYSLVIVPQKLTRAASRLAGKRVQTRSWKIKTQKQKYGLNRMENTLVNV